MKCPACGSQLHEHSSGELSVDICSEGCAGIWFDKAELDKCDELTERFAENLLRVLSVSNVVIDRNKDRHCPRCTNQLLVTTLYDSKSRIEIDYCAGCGGHWLDIGELENIRQENQDAADRDAVINDFYAKHGNDTSASSRVKAVLKLIF